MEHRKVQEMGGGTHLVSLPKEWSRRNGLRRGSTVTVEETVDGALLIVPSRGERKAVKEMVIPYPATYPRLLINEVTGAYLLGYDVITIRGEGRITYDDRELVKKAVRQLVGLEIVEEDAKSLTVQFLLETTTLEPEKIFRRMHMIAKGMHVDAIASLMERDKHLVRVVAERDEEVDRLYFLIVRLIRTAILDSSLASKYRLSPIDCLDYRVAANLLEGVGDSAVQLAHNTLRLSGAEIDPQLESTLRNISDRLQSSQDLAVKSFLNKKPEDAREVVKLYGQVSESIKGIEASISRGNVDQLAAAHGITSGIDKIARSHVDIVDLVAPMYPMVM